MYNSRKNLLVLFLLVLWRIQSITGNIHFRLALITMHIQSIAAANQKGYDTEYLQIKQEYGRIYPAIGNVFQFGVFYLYFLIHNYLIARQK